MQEIADLKSDEALEKAVREAAHEMINQIISYFFKEGTTINEIIIVPINIMSRIVRVHDAIQLLIKEQHPSEAAVLALTQFELRLDLAYTASDVKHAAAWLEHENTKWPLMSVKGKMDLLFKESKEVDDLSAIFVYLSGIKHGNPVYSELGFPGRAFGQSVKISTGPLHDDFENELSSAVFKYSIFQTAWSAQVLNFCIAKYARMDSSIRENVRNLCISLQPFQKEFRVFLQNVAEHRPGHFGIKSYKRTETT